MSNAGRPRTEMKPCPHCGSTDRDSNGQCACRNAAYRARKKAERAALASEQPPAVPEPTPAPEPATEEQEGPAHALVKLLSGYECACGFEGKSTLHSVRAHVARERRLAEQAALQ